MNTNTGSPGLPVNTSQSSQEADVDSNIIKDKQDNSANDTDMREGNSESQQINPNIDFNNRYKSTDQGPYCVYVEHKTKNIGR